MHSPTRPWWSEEHFPAQERLALGRGTLPTALPAPRLAGCLSPSCGASVETRAPHECSTVNWPTRTGPERLGAHVPTQGSAPPTARGRRPGVSSQDPCSVVPEAPVPLHTGRTLGRKGTEPTDTPRQALPTPAVGSPWGVQRPRAGPDLECPVPQVVSLGPWPPPTAGHLRPGQSPAGFLGKLPSTPWLRAQHLGLWGSGT